MEHSIEQSLYSEMSIHWLKISSIILINIANLGAKCKHNKNTERA